MYVVKRRSFFPAVAQIAKQINIWSLVARLISTPITECDLPGCKGPLPGALVPGILVPRCVVSFDVHF